MLASIFVFFSLIYLLALILVMIGLSRLKLKKARSFPSISVVIAARNEEQRIDGTLESLEKLDYPADRYEVIFVDDASSDNTAAKIQAYAGKHENWKLIRLAEKSSRLKGKKKALKKGIGQAKGELIFTTDADCRVPASWLKNMSAYFDEQTAMVLGHSPLKTSNLLLNFDNLFSAIVTAAPAKLGFSHSSVGRNLAYRKDVYEQVGGFDALEKFRSGDDVHLTEQFRKRANAKIEYCADPGTFVETLPPSTAKEVFHQQIRKNSKTLKKSWPTVVFSLIVFFCYALFLLLPLIDRSLTGLWLMVMAAKFLLEFFALSQASVIFRKKTLLLFLPLMQIVYPFYIMFFSLLGSMQIYQWKR